MGLISVNCPQCGHALSTINENLDAHKSVVCPNCRERVKFEYDAKTKRVFVPKGDKDNQK